jgi:two-component system CheB/CheR fusion protein
MVIVQDPTSSEYKSMPEHAIESGFYDFILSPEAIPQQIVNYIRQRTLSNTFSELDSSENEAEISEVINIIKSSTPLDFSNYKRPTIVRRIVRRVVANNAATSAITSIY